MKEILSDYSFETQFMQLDSIDLAYVKEGQGSKNLLFVHGLSSNLEAWSHNIEELKNSATCYALDLPGYGKSSKPDVSYTPSYFSDILYEFIKTMQLEKVVLIGHSMGGQAAIKLALNHPEVVESLILIAPAGIEQFSDNEAAIMKASLTTELIANTSEDQIDKNYALNFYQAPDDVLVMIKDRKNIRSASDFEIHVNAIVKSVYGMLEDPVHKQLEAIETKTLVVFGRNDYLIPNKYFHPKLTTELIGQMALDKIPVVQVEFVDEGGHFIQFEKPKEVNELINSFLKR